jgi:hypothetical protein
MKPTREYVSPDNQLTFVVDHDEQDVSLGFEGFPWHTHANVLASQFGTSEELAVNRFVRDLLSDRSILVVSRIGGTIRDVWITADPQSDLRYRCGRSSSAGVGREGLLDLDVPSGDRGSHLVGGSARRLLDSGSQ